MKVARTELAGNTPIVHTLTLLMERQDTGAHVSRVTTEVDITIFAGEVSQSIVFVSISVLKAKK